MATSLAGPKGGYFGGSAAAIRRDQLGFYESCAREYGDVFETRLRPHHVPRVPPPGGGRGVVRGADPRLHQEPRGAIAAPAAGRGPLPRRGRIVAAPAAAAAA